MAFVLKRNFIYQILFALCIAVPYLGNYELTFAVWCFTVFLTLKNYYSLTFLKYAFCFLLILILAFFSTNYSEAEPFFAIRDITYLLKPVLGLFLGYQICRFNYTNTFRTIVNVGFAIAVMHILIMIHSVIVYGAATVNDIRFYSGYFSDFEVYALIILIFHEKFGIVLSKKKFYILTAVVGFSAFMYLARSNFIQFIILYMGIKGYFILNKRAIIAIISFIVLTLVSYSAILYINPKRNGEGFEAFLYKIKVAPTEPFKTRIDEDDYKDFNDNYRSVEMNFTLNQVSNDGTKAIIFGQGLGSQIDLKQEVYLGDMNLRYISVLHNSFMTVLLKSGVLGILLLLFSIYLLYNRNKTDIPINYNINMLLMGTAVFLVVSNWVLMGYYFTQDSKSILVGLLLAYIEITRKKLAAEQLKPSI